MGRDLRRLEFLSHDVPQMTLSQGSEYKMLRELCGRRLRHDRGEPLQLGDELVGRRALRELRVELGEGIHRLEAGLAVERACTVPQLVLGRDQAMADQTPDCEPVARGKSEVLPSVLAPHGRVRSEERRV